MCFAPYISLSTFVIELLFAIYFITRNPKDKLNRLLAITTLLLGIYQLNEFLICYTGLSVFTRLAMSVTAIFPAIGISYALILSRIKIKRRWQLAIYLPVIFFISWFAITVKKLAICSTVFIQYPAIGLVGKFFNSYYVLYIVGALIIMQFGKVKNKHEVNLRHLGMLGIITFTVPTYIFLRFLPMLEIHTASVLCEFALLLTIEFIVVLWYKEKHKLKY